LQGLRGPRYSPRCALLREILITPPPGTLSIQAEDRAPLSSAEVGQLFNIDS